MYDRFGKDGVRGANGGGNGADFGDIGDIFESIFGSAFGGARQQRGPARGADLRYDMEIRLEDAFSGCTREIEVDVAARCETCDGSGAKPGRSEEHTSELQSLMRISYAVFCLKKKQTKKRKQTIQNQRRNTTI